MHTRAALIGLLALTGASQATPLMAAEDSAPVCGHTLALKPGTHETDAATLRVERQATASASGKLYLVTIVGDEAVLMAGETTDPAGAYALGTPAKLIVICAREPVGWLSGLAAGATLVGEARARLSALLDGQPAIRPRGLGPEIHRPDYEGFGLITLPEGVDVATAVLDLGDGG